MSKGNNLPLVSVIALNWNTAEVTCDFLRSITEQCDYPNLEVIIVDNGSTEDPTAKLKAVNPAVKVILTGENLGFAGGNNTGMREAKGDYFFIVNNDTEFTPGLIESLLLPFSTDPSIGVVCPKIRFFYNPSIIQYAGFFPISVYTGRTTAVGSHEEDKGQYDKPAYTEAAHGCAMMVKREVAEKTGMFPEKFFLYYEEWDWSFRILKGGYKIFYQPEALIYHKESMTVGKQNPMKVYYHTRNRILFMRRNMSGFHLSIFICFFTLFTMPKSVVKYAAKRQFTHLKYFLKGVGYNMRTSTSSVV
jgi:GT2 family glycosyltransferase